MKKFTTYEEFNKLVKAKEKEILESIQFYDLEAKDKIIAMAAVCELADLFEKQQKLMGELLNNVLARGH